MGRIRLFYLSIKNEQSDFPFNEGVPLCHFIVLHSFIYFERSTDYMHIRNVMITIFWFNVPLSLIAFIFFSFPKCSPGERCSSLAL